MWNVQVDEKLPSWIQSRILINELEDESEVFQYGLSDASTFYEFSHMAV